MVRDATAADLEAINKIENDAILTQFGHFGTSPLLLEATQTAFDGAAGIYPWVVAELDGIVRGFARAGVWKPREAYRWTTEVGVYVDPSCHRRGIGKELYCLLFQLLKEQGFHTIVAGITIPNEASIKLHESLGMVKIGVFPDMGYKMGEWRSVGYWTKVIGEGPPGQ